MTEEYIPRQVEPLLKKALDQKETLALVGARQVGKTTLFQRLKNYLIKEKGVSEKLIFWFSCDDLSLRANLKKDFYYLQTFIETRLTISLDQLSERIFVFLDEAQYTPEVFNFVKLLYDQYQEKIKFLISGSTSLDIRAKSAESLAGRISYFYLKPLSLEERLRHHFALKINSSFFPKLTDGLFLENQQKEKQALLFEKNRPLKRFLRESFLFGGMPAVWQKTAKERLSYLKNLITTYIDKDIKDLKEVGDIEAFHFLLQVLAGEVGGVLNLSNLSQAAGLAVNTLKKYKNIFKQTFVLNELPAKVALRKRFVKSPKVYFEDLGIANVLAGRDSFKALELAQVKGKLLENLIIKSFSASVVNWPVPPNLFFWRDYEGHEIDLVIEKGEIILPVEITLESNLSKSKKSNFAYFFNNFPKAKFSILVYDGLLEKEKVGKKTVYLLPWWLWW